MIIVSNLIRSVFGVLCFSMIIMELVAFLFVIFLYGDALKMNNMNISSKTHEISKDILFSYNSLLTETLTNAQTDLLLIAKHIFPFYLSEIKSSQDDYLQFSSDFILNFKGCLADKEKESEIDKFLYENNFTYKDIDVLINSNELNQIDYYYGDSSIDKNILERYVCYTVSMLKSIFIRNYVVDKSTLSEKNFTLYIGNNIFTYPSYGTLSFDTIKKNFYYNTESDNCKNEYDISCLNIKTDNNDIVFNDPIIDDKGNIITRGCIKIPFDLSDTNSFACVNIDITVAQQNLNTEENSILNITLVQSKDNDVKVLYSLLPDREKDPSNKFKEIFNNSIFGDFEIKNDYNDKYYSLFHFLYYSMIQMGNYENANELITEYKTIKNDLIEQINSFTVIDKEQLCNSSHFFDYTKIHTFNITLNQKEKLFDDFFFILSPIAVPYTTYNTTGYTYSTDKCSSQIIVYSLLIAKGGIVSTTKSIYNLLIYKALRSLFFFVFLTIACTTIFYLIMYSYLSVLFEPVKLLKSIFYSVIKKIKNKRIKEENKDSREDEKEDKKELKVQKRQNEMKLYKNIETKEISKTFKLFNQILLLSNNKELSRNYHTKVQLYNKFYQSLKNEHLKQKCELLIGYFNLKNKNYIKSSEIFSDLLQKLEYEEKSLLKKKSNLEENIFNLPLQIVEGTKYINDYSKDITFTRASKTFVNLKILLQKTYYLLGLSKYNEFKIVKKRIKQRLREELEEKDNDIENSEEREKKQRERKIKYEKGIAKIKLPENILLLEQAISNLTKSLEINKTMKVNPIKSIFTQILISKCYYEMEEIPTCAKYLKDSLISLTQLDQIVYDSASSNIISIENENNNKKDPNERIMIIANSVIMENILYNIAKICIKKSKKYVSIYILSRLLELNYYISDEIQNKVCNKLYELIQTKKSVSKINNNENEIINIIKQRTSPIRTKKALGILYSDTISKENLSHIILEQVVMKEIASKFDKEDLISFAEVKNEMYKLIELNKKDDFIEMKSKNEMYNPFSSRQSFLLVNRLIEGMSDKDKEEYDKVIFAFITPDDFFNKTQYKDQNELIEQLNQHNIGLYLFCFGEITNEHYDIFNYVLRKLKEGFLIKVTNLNVIKMAFENISRLKPTTLINFNFDNYTNIFSGKNIHLG